MAHSTERPAPSTQHQYRAEQDRGRRQQKFSHSLPQRWGYTCVSENFLNEEIGKTNGKGRKQNRTGQGYSSYPQVTFQGTGLPIMAFWWDVWLNENLGFILV